jgi:DNA-binding GntR family transcriptional regulator
VLSGILSSIQSLLRVWITRLLQATDSPRTTYLVHVPIADAVITGDGDAAAAAMTRHLNDATDLLLTDLAANGKGVNTGPQRV